MLIKHELANVWKKKQQHQFTKQNRFSYGHFIQCERIKFCQTAIAMWSETQKSHTHTHNHINSATTTAAAATMRLFFLQHKLRAFHLWPAFMFSWIEYKLKVRMANTWLNDSMEVHNSYFSIWRCYGRQIEQQRFDKLFMQYKKKRMDDQTINQKKMNRSNTKETTKRIFFLFQIGFDKRKITDKH